MRDLREEILSEEARAEKAALTVRPVSTFFEADDGSEPSNEGLRKWNRSQRLTRQLKNAAMVLSKSETWRRIAKSLPRRSGPLS